MNIHALLIMLGVGVSVVAEPKGVRVSPLEEVPMVFEPIADVAVYQREWTIITEFQPTDITKLVSVAEELVEQEQAMCGKAGNKLAKRCIIPYAETRAVVELLKRGQEAVWAVSRRRNKRSLDFVGEALHWAFGIMDEKSARSIVEKVEGVQEGEVRTYELLDKEVTVVRRAYDRVAGPLESITREVEDMRKFLTWSSQGESRLVQAERARVVSLEFRVDMLERLSRISVSLLEAQGIQQSELAILDDLMGGRLHPRVLSDGELSNLVCTLPESEGKSWVSANWVQALRVASVRAFPESRGLRVVVKVPMPEGAQFEMNAIYAVPMKLGGNWDGMVELSTEYLAFSAEGNRVIGFSRGEMAECKSVSVDGGRARKVCPIPRRLGVTGGMSCEENVFRQLANASSVCRFWATPRASDLLIRTHSEGRWLFRLSKGELFTVACGGGFWLTRLEGFGQVELEEGCTMIGTRVNITHQSALLSRAEVKPFRMGVSGVFEELERYRPVLGEMEANGAGALQIRLTAHESLHEELQGGRQELEDLAGEVSRQKELGLLRRGQFRLEAIGYSVGGLFGIMVVVGLLGVWMGRSRVGRRRMEAGSRPGAVSISGPIIVPDSPLPERTRGPAGAGTKRMRRVSFSV